MARPHQGKFLGVPYNFSSLSREDRGRGLWDPEDSRVITPMNYGWGYSVNFAALSGRRRRGSGTDHGDDESGGTR